MQIYVQRNGQQAGPYSPEHIQQELAAGTIRPNDLAWYEGAPNWLPLASVPGLNVSPSNAAVPGAGAPYSAPYATAPYPVPNAVMPGGYPSSQIQTSGAAVASMVLGLLGFLSLGLTSLPAIICGHIGLSNINKSMGRLGGRGMAITGLVTGYLNLLLFAVVIIGIIAGIALPVFNTVQERGAATISLAKAKQIGLGCKLYASDNDGRYPKTLDELVPVYISDRQIFVCPLDRNKSPMGYEYFGDGLTDSDDPHTVLLQSKATTSDGKRAVIHLDNAGEVIKR